MSEAETAAQGQKPKICKLAVASLSLGVLGVLIFPFTGAIYAFWPSEVLGPYGFNIVGLPGIIGLILGVIALARIKKSRPMFKGGGFAVAGIVLTALLSGMWWLLIYGPRGKATPYWMICRTNLSNLGKAIGLYMGDNGRYPEPNQWCDLLLEDGAVTVKDFFCPGFRTCQRFRFIWRVPKKGRCHYAMNPNCDPNLPPDMVLLFESEEGWNQFGGPELLTTKWHQGDGCNVLFNDGLVKFVKPQRLGQLKWKVEEKGGEPEESNSANYRTPANDEQLRHWLENMVWYHRFTNEEIRLATGLTEEEIVAAKERFDIRVDNRPKRDKDTPLLVLPYPGGRHPRIGFLEGAVDPQRETKFSVFTPWDPNSYVVVDLPEAIWSNLGLTYLAHTHIDTIWTKQGIELPKLEWNRHADGMLDIERELPNGISFGVKVKPTREAVRMELWLKNGTEERLTDLRVQICVMPKMAKGFAQQTNENKVFTNPYVACRASDGTRWVITAWESCHRPWGNERCPCFHSDPKFPDLEPGQMHRLRGWLSFYEGKDIEAEFERIEKTGWRKQP